MGELSDPQVPGRAGNRHRPDRPADHATLGRRRAGRGGGALGDLERGVRRHGVRLRSVPFTPEKVKAASRAA